ncbi:hypothetical protein [Rhodoblastus acidophilus]|uniref:hypothetical protein n=1 Tax=Rhodoblastus acidophilus TaxID=1074 RepID=UPI0023DD70EE|nr:hypothetical protein [Rhodoblastus acidophilus]
MGHMLLHDKTAKAFSAADAERLPSIPKEQSAEWQADRFCDHYLLPIKFVESLNFDAHLIVNQCNVPHRIALRQIINAQRILKVGTSNYQT